MEIAELINKLVENQQQFGDIWESLDTDIKEALEKERPETLEKLGEWHNTNNDLIEKIFSIVNDMLPFVDPEFFEDTGEEVTEQYIYIVEQCAYVPLSILEMVYILSIEENYYDRNTRFYLSPYHIYT